MAGGGTSPSTYPDYMQDVHLGILAGIPGLSATTNDFSQYGNMLEVFAETLAAGSPYASVTAYDPSSDLDTMQEKLDDWFAELDSMDPESVIETFNTSATTAAGTTVATAEIDAVVDAFEARSQGAFMRNVSRFATGMFDIGAVMTTQYGMGLAQMELDRQDQLNDMDARLRLMAERERYQAAMQYTGEMARLLTFQLQERRGSVGAQSDVSRYSITALQDQIGLDLGYEASDATWNLELFQFPMQATNALSGSIQMYKRQTAGERLAAAVMTAGSFGLQTGTAMGSPAAGFLAGGVSLATQLLAGVA